MRYEELRAGIPFLPKCIQNQARRALGLPVKAERKYHVFLYGTCPRGNAALVNATCRSPRVAATVTGSLYALDGGMPAFVREGETNVRGEVVWVDADALRSLDILHNHPRCYRRMKLRINAPRFTPEEAWVYVRTRLPEDARIVPSGDWNNR